ncbi:hypothetical protein KCV05_g69, partial [Aureobasidium melanogenum]
MSSHINSKPSLDLPQTNSSSNVLPTLQLSNLLVSHRLLVHANSKTSDGSGQSFFIAIVVIVVAIDNTRDGKGKDFFELFAHGLSGFADASRLFATVAAEDGAGEDFGLGQGSATACI